MPIVSFSIAGRPPAFSSEPAFSSASASVTASSGLPALCSSSAFSKTRRLPGTQNHAGSTFLKVRYSNVRGASSRIAPRIADSASTL